MRMSLDGLLPIPLSGSIDNGISPAPSVEHVIDAEIHPIKPWILLALSSGRVRVCWSESGEALHEFDVDQTKYGSVKAARFFDADSLIHVHLLPPALVGEARLSLIVTICAKGIVVYDCITRVCVPHAPPVLATGTGHAARSSGGALSGASVGVSCEHMVVGTTFGSLFTFNVRTGVVSAFSGTTKLHEKSIVGLVAITGRPSQQLHRSRIVTACSGGIVAVWEIPCETPIYKSGPRVLVQNAKAPVLNMRFDSTRNRLACCFANGSAMVWAFEEHSQEEALMVSIAKGFAGDQVAIPRGSWNVPDEALLMITPGYGSLALVLPSATVSKTAHQLLKGIRAVSTWESRSSILLAGTSEAVVAVRTIVSFHDKSKGANSKKITKFWQHPVNPNIYLLLAEDVAGVPSVLFYDRKQLPPAYQVDRFSMPPGKLVVAMDGRLAVRSGLRYQSEKTFAWISPFVTPEVTPKVVKDWAVPGDIPPEVLSSINPDDPIMDLWPGPVHVQSFKFGDSILLGLTWPEAHRYTIVELKSLSTSSQSTSAESPQSALTVLHFGGGDTLAFTVVDDECIVLIGRQEEIVTGPATALVESRSSKGLLTSLPSFRSRSLNKPGMTTTTASTSPLSFLSRQKKEEAPPPVIHYYLGAMKVTPGVSSSSSPSLPFVEILVNQPVKDLVANLGCADLFLMRCDPPEKLSKSLKPWTRFFSLSSLLHRKTLVHAGPLLPAHRLVSAWIPSLATSSENEPVEGRVPTVTLAMSFEQIVDRITVMDVMEDGAIRFRHSVFTHSTSPCVSLKLYAGTLFMATCDQVIVAFVGGQDAFRGQNDDDAPQFVIAARGRNALSSADHHQHSIVSNNSRKESLHVHDEANRPEDAAFAPSSSLLKCWEYADAEDQNRFFPVPALKSSLHELHLLGVDTDSSGDLLTLFANGKIGSIPLKHPLIRMGMLASAGFPASALRWTQMLTDSVQVRDEAVMLLARLGFPREAALVTRASPGLVLDICIRYRLVEEAVKVFANNPKSRAFKQLNGAGSEEVGAKGLSHHQRLALLLVSEGRAELVRAYVPRLKAERDKDFCRALVVANDARVDGGKKKPMT